MVLSVIEHGESEALSQRLHSQIPRRKPLFYFLMNYLNFKNVKEFVVIKPALLEAFLKVTNISLKTREIWSLYRILLCQYS